MKLARLTVLLSLVVLGCPPVDPVIPPPTPPPNTDLCATMCDHLLKLGCEEGQPVYNNDLAGPVDVPNQSCADNCVELQGKGFFVNPKCVLQVTTCDQIEPFRQKDPSACGV